MLIAHFLLVFACRPSAPAETRWEPKFNKAYEAAQAADEAGKWEEAAALYLVVQTYVPHENSTLYARARCLAHLKRHDEALASLRDAVENGWNQSEQLASEKAFGDIRDRGEFKRLFRRIEAIDREDIVVFIPPGLDTTKQAPLIIAFHGRCENPHYFIRSWKDTATRLGAVVVAPRGVHRLANHSVNVWEDDDARANRHGADIDLEACRKVTDRAVQNARQTANIDPERMVLVGYSQGGAVALEMLMDDPKRFAGAFAQATLYHERSSQQWKGARAVRCGRVVILTGEFDGLRSQGEQARDDLREAGWDVRYEMAKGVGHEPPEDDQDRQMKAIRYILRLDAPTAP